MVKIVKFVLIMVNESSGCDCATSLVNWEESARVEGSGARTPGRIRVQARVLHSTETVPFQKPIKGKFFFYFLFFSSLSKRESLSRLWFSGDGLHAVRREPLRAVVATVVRWIFDERETPNDRSGSPLSRSVLGFSRKCFNNRESNFLDSEKKNFVFVLLWSVESPTGAWVYCWFAVGFSVCS